MMQKQPVLLKTTNPKYHGRNFPWKKEPRDYYRYRLKTFTPEEIPMFWTYDFKKWQQLFSDCSFTTNFDLIMKHNQKEQEKQFPERDTDLVFNMHFVGNFSNEYF